MAERQDRLAMMIAEAAYYLAEKRNFKTGHEWEDWLHAEQEIKASLPILALAAPVQKARLQTSEVLIKPFKLRRKK